MEHPLYNEYNSYFSHIGCYNGSLGEIYNNRKNMVYPVACKNWSCPKCRKILKYNLFVEVFYLVYALNLDRHFIITFRGNRDYKRGYGVLSEFEDSYRIMSKLWNKFKKVIEYHKGKFDYILLSRSQNDGFCHFHILLPKYISWYFLDKKRKLYDDLGYLSINKNRSVADYLHKDFFKDSEYWIPKGVKNYKSSRGIKFNKYKENDFKLENCFILGKHTMKDFEDLVESRFGRCLPIDYYMKRYVDCRK